MKAIFHWLSYIQSYRFVARGTSTVLVLCTLVLAPLPNGSADRGWVIFWCACLALAVAFASTQTLRAVHLRVLAPALALFLGFAALAWLQTRVGPPFGSSNPIWATTQDLLETTVNRRVSVTSVSPAVAFGPPLALFLSFFATFIVSTWRTGARLILRAAAMAAAFYAAWALGDLFYFDARLLFSDKAASLDVLNLPFANRNHAATYYGTGSLLWLMLLLSGLQERIGRSGLTLAELGPALLAQEPRKLIAAALGFLLCMTADFMTLSRAGVLLTLATIMLALGLFSYRWLRGHPRLPIVLAVAVLAIALLAEIAGGRLGLRIGAEGLTDIGRREAYLSTLAIIRDHPLLGTGYGTFAEVFPLYRSALVSINGVWDRAHDTPLELAAEMGVPFVVALGVVWTYFMVRLLRGVFARNRDAVLPLAGFSVALLGTLHSLVDFPLQIPGYAMVWSALVAMGLAQSFSSREVKKGEHRPTEARGTKTLELTAPLQTRRSKSPHKQPPLVAGRALV